MLTIVATAWFSNQGSSHSPTQSLTTTSLSEVSSTGSSNRNYSGAATARHNTSTAAAAVTITHKATTMYGASEVELSACCFYTLRRGVKDEKARALLDRETEEGLL